MKAIVIGSGLAGLISAAALAKNKAEVTVFEQFDRPGGVTAPYEAQGYRWDLGQLVVEGFGADEPCGSILKELGVLDKVKLRPEDRGYVFPDFELRKPESFGGVKWRLELLKKLFPGEEKGLERYWKDFLRFTRLMTIVRRMEKSSGVQLQWLKARMYLTLLPFLPKARWSARQLMDDYFESEKLKCVFISILADFFSPPSQFLGLGVFALNAELTFDKRMPHELGKDCTQVGFYSILGGIGTLVDSLVERIEALGGKVLVNHPVTRIVVENNRVTGVVDGRGEFYPADVVVASGGVRETYLNLVGEEHLPAGYAEQVRSVPLMDSVFMLHLGIDFDPSPYLHGPVTYFYGSYDIEGEIEKARAGEYHEGRAGFVVHVPSLHSPSMAPANCHAMTVYTICPERLAGSSDEGDGGWTERKEEFTEKLLDYAEQHIPGLKQHIQVCEVITPPDWQKRTHTAHHAFGGIAPLLGSWKAPHKSPVEGLWFVGAQSESGGGVNAVIPAAYKTAKAILKGS